MKRLDQVSRLLLAAVFVSAGINKLRQPEGQEAYIKQLGLRRARETRLAVGAIEIAGGAALGLGVMPGLTAAALAVYLVPVTGVAHRKEPIQVLKNLAIIGGLLQVAHARQQRREAKRELRRAA